MRSVKCEAFDALTLTAVKWTKKLNGWNKVYFIAHMILWVFPHITYQAGTKEIHGGFHQWTEAHWFHRDTPVTWLYSRWPMSGVTLSPVSNTDDGLSVV